MNVRDAWIEECIACEREGIEAPALRHIVVHNWDWFSRPRRGYINSVGWYDLIYQQNLYVHPRLVKARYAKGFKPHGERRRRHSANDR